MTRDSLSLAQARRVALAAQGFNQPRPARVAAGALTRTLDRIALLQIDSVNVVARAHYLPLFSRLGAYDVEVLHRAAGRAPRRVFEYWGHEASYIRVDLQPSLRFRMESAAAEAWGSVRRLGAEQPGFVAWVLQEVKDRGPLTARDIEHDVPRTRDQWGWNWSQVKTALEWLFYSGQVTVSHRNTSFERVYDTPERVLPERVLAAPTPTVAAAQRNLVRVAARAHGVGTEKCLRDYFRLRPAPARAAIADLVDAGELRPVTVAGWSRQAYLWHEAVVPRRITTSALISPFDSLIFERTRTELLFDYRYRIEIYVPAGRRVYGYYVYSYLLDDQIVARVDLKADRKEERLLVAGAYAEPAAPGETPERLTEALRSLGAWLGCEEVVVAPRGDLAPALAALNSPLST